MIVWQNKKGKKMEELKEFMLVAGVFIAYVFICIIGIGLLVLLIASPFLAVGFGIGSISWATCLLAPFC